MREKLCFVIMGYGNKVDYSTGKTFDLDKTYINVIKPAVMEAGLTCVRGDEVHESGLIDRSMYGLLVQADLVIADITTFNPNAIYELGIRHAAKPYSTIIIKEKQGPITFDLNHNKIFHYEHLGDDIGVTEAERCKKELILLIKQVTESPKIDSPFFEFIPSAKPNILPDDEYNSIINELSEKEKSIFAIVENARQRMEASNFVEAKKLWQKAIKKSADDSYYIQQCALATYKSKEPEEEIALNDALQIINQLQPDETNDPETLGICGAINKRLYFINDSIGYLNRAISYYQKGFELNSDYYTGDNYTFCLDEMSIKTKDNDEKIYYTIQAKKIRERIIKIIDEIFGDDNYEKRSDIKWIYATYATCQLALGNEYEEYEKLFKEEKTTVDWEMETYEKQKKRIIELKGVN